jgi:predicted transposase YbfD/YdcC
VRVVSITADQIRMPHAAQLVAVSVERTIKRTGQTSYETRYYVTSRPATEASGKALATAIRGHWAGIENRLHWRRDAIWGEDRCRSRRPAVAANLALLRTGLWARLCRTGDTHLPGWCERVAAQPALGLQLLLQ